VDHPPLIRRAPIGSRRPAVSAALIELSATDAQVCEVDIQSLTL
jgi:hypothetical protein